ncbi:MAG: TolC family protein [Pirellulaceae bacterium]
MSAATSRARSLARAAFLGITLASPTFSFAATPAPSEVPPSRSLGSTDRQPTRLPAVSATTERQPTRPASIREVRPVNFVELSSPLLSTAMKRQEDRANNTQLPSPPPVPADLPMGAGSAESIQQPQTPVHTDAAYTLEELQGIALGNNPTLAEARALVEAARGKWVQAGLPPNFWLGYSGQQLGSSGQAEQQGVYIAQEIVRGHKLQLSRAVASGEINRLQQQWAAQEQRVLTDVRIAYYDVLIAQRRMEITAQLRDIASKAVQTVEALKRGQEASQLDVFRAQVELQSAALLLKTADNALTASWTRLTAVLGAPTLVQRPVVGSLDGEFARLDIASQMQRILAESPEIAAAAAEIERSRWAIARARAEAVPNVEVQGIVQHDNATGSSNGNLQVALPIPLWNRNQGGVRQARAELSAAERALNRTELSLQQRLASAYQQYANARNQVQDYSRPDGILDTARRSLELVNSGYRAGELNFLDLLTAQRTNSQTNLAYIEALGELWTAIAEIDGLLLKDSLNASPGGN